jgi:hypothetical protein
MIKVVEKISSGKYFGTKGVLQTLEQMSWPWMNVRKNKIEEVGRH